MTEIINTPNAPAAIGPYSQATKLNGVVYTSGQVAFDPKTMEVVEGGIKEQTEQVMKNLMVVLEEAGASASTVFKTTCFLSDMNNFAEFNAIYGEFLDGNKPARSCVEVARLPRDVLVEVEAIAVCK